MEARNKKVEQERSIEEEAYPKFGYAEVKQILKKKGGDKDGRV